LTDQNQTRCNELRISFDLRIGWET